MIKEIQEWLTAQLPDYKPFIGEWSDDPTLDKKFIYAVQGTGGAGPRVGDRYPTYRVLLLGPKNGRKHQLQILADANDLIKTTLDQGGIMPCGAANIRATGEPAGPGLTTENRVWVSIHFEITF